MYLVHIQCIIQIPYWTSIRAVTKSLLIYHRSDTSSSEEEIEDLDLGEEAKEEEAVASWGVVPYAHEPVPKRKRNSEDIPPNYPACEKNKDKAGNDW